MRQTAHNHGHDPGGTGSAQGAPQGFGLTLEPAASADDVNDCRYLGCLMSAQACSHGTLLELATRSLDEQPLALGMVARAVIRLTADPAISITRLARAISADPGLSVTIIRKANCAFYASHSVVASVPLAVVKIGITATRSVAISGSIYAMF